MDRWATRRRFNLEGVGILIQIVWFEKCQRSGEGQTGVGLMLVIKAAAAACWAGGALGCEVGGRLGKGSSADRPIL